MHFKELEKQEQAKPKINRRKEIITIRVEINEIEMKKTIQKIKEIKSCFFEKINKINKPLSRLREKEKIQINKIRNEKGDTTTETLERIIRYYLKGVI